MIKKIFVTCLLSLLSCFCLAGEKIELYVGEIKILNVGNIERIAVGKSDVISNSLLNNGQLLLIAEAPGSSSVHIWLPDGSKKEYTVHVIDKSDNLVKRKLEIEELLAGIDGLNVNIVGEKIVLSGSIAYGHENAITKVGETYDDVLIATHFAVNELVRQKLEIEDLLSDVDGLNVRIVGERVVLSGLVDNGHDAAITTVIGAYTGTLDLTERGNLDMDMPDNKMVLTSIKIADFDKNYLDTLGIEWDTQIQGPSAGGSTLYERGPTLGVPTTTPLNFANSTGGIDSSLGYFGIATEITSRINFAVDSGHALILAEPRLAARSGGTATFLSGGEFPIEISNINGTTVEFKEFGIQLTVEPEVDQNNNIRAKVTTELSSINNAVAVNNIPGLDTRKTEADVLLGSGETLVMSGLLSQEASKDIGGVKFLMDIPILGALFRSESFRDNKSELVIFVTPTVFNANSSINSDAIKYAKEKIEDVIEAIDENSLDIVY